MTLLHKQVKELVDSAERILLLTDERIDGDTIGSTLGMFHVLKDLGKDVDVFSPKPILESLAFLPGKDVIQRDPSLFEDAAYDLVMVFDCSDGEYFKEHLPKLAAEVPLVVFDHHATNPRYGSVNVIEPEAAATADVVYRFVKSAGYPLNKNAAQCILTGISTDTSNFSTSNTTVASLEAAHDLAQRGAKLSLIVRETMMNKSMTTLKLWGLAFERLHENKEHGALVTAIRQKDLSDLGATSEDVKALSNFLNAMVEGADVVMVLRETEDGGVKGSVRSQSRDVTKLAQRYGGGGHKRAAGFFVENATLIEQNGQWEIVRTS